MEDQLFTWNRWDPADTGAFQFYECTLVHPIGNFPRGSFIPSIFIDYETAEIEFYNDNGKVIFSGKLALSIVK